MHWKKSDSVSDVDGDQTEEDLKQHEKHLEREKDVGQELKKKPINWKAVE